VREAGAIKTGYGWLGSCLGLGGCAFTGGSSYYCMAFNLKKVLRALLFSSGQPLTIKDIQTTFARFHDSEEAREAAEQDAAETGTLDGAALAVVASGDQAEAEGEPWSEEDRDLYAEVPSLVTATQIRDAFAEIAAEIAAADEGLLLIEGSSGYRLVTHPRFARWVRLLRGEPAPARLSRTALETLAIVAYRQPVTRSEIETIRGVSADAGLNKLIERELVYVVGRAELPGRPIQYGTTDQFLDFVGLRSLDELPASDVLSNRQINEWLQTAAEAAAAPQSLADEAMGLPLEEGEGETPNLEAVSLEPAASTTAPEPPAGNESENAVTAENDMAQVALTPVEPAEKEEPA